MCLPLNLVAVKYQKEFLKEIMAKGVIGREHSKLNGYHFYH